MASAPEGSGGTTDVQAVADAGFVDTMAADPSVVTSVGPEPEAERRRGDKLGRYTILEQLGSGGMGVVYAAYDPQLDRKVAVKLLHRRGRAGGTARLLREAQAMAKLSHPNVVTVLDVGEQREQVFVAMEYVVGTTLTAWLVAPRPWREVLDVMIGAGHGLAAAHHAGLLHRDVKPDNILVGDDGRARVADFGLARAADDSLSISSVSDTGTGDEPVSVLGADLTRTGALLGTPAYMAPEQLRGEASAAADQFSFCVALYEALYGARPFVGATTGELDDAIRAGRVREPPSGTTVPPWLRRVIVRGLAADPRARHPSIEALLDALDRDPTRRRRRIAAAIGALLAIGGGATALAMRGGASSPPCAHAGDAIASVWSPARAAAVQAAFARTGVPWAQASWSTVQRTLDAYARRWAVMRDETCVLGEQGSPVAPAREVCLDRRLHELTSQIDLFARADARLVGHAVASAERLSSLDACADLRATLDGDAAAVAAARPMWDRLDEAEPRLHAGQAGDALEVAKQVAADAHRQHLSRVEGEADAMVGAALDAQGDAAGAEAQYFATVRAAEAAGDDVRVLGAWDALAYIVGYEQERHVEGRRDAELAEAVLERIGGDERLRADLDDTRGTLEWSEGDYAAARRDHTAALAARERLLGPDNLDVASSLANLGVVEKADGHYDLAEAYDRRAIAIVEKEVGGEHPKVAGLYGNLANVYAAQGDDTTALDLQQRALAIAEKAESPDSPDLAEHLNAVGAELSNLGRNDEALPVLQRALAIQARVLGDHPDVATTVSNIALIDLAAGRADVARAGFERSLAIDEKVYGADHPAVAQDLDNLGDTLLQLHHADDALARHQRALAIREKALGPDHADLAVSLVGVGNALVALGRGAEALAPLERAVALRAAATGDPLDLADARFALAKALGAVGRDLPRARDLAGKAEDAFTAAGAAGASRKADVTAWLAAHPS